jgi:hypothetical protein
MALNIAQRRMRRGAVAINPGRVKDPTVKVHRLIVARERRSMMEKIARNSQLIREIKELSSFMRSAAGMKLKPAAVRAKFVQLEKLRKMLNVRPNTNEIHAEYAKKIEANHRAWAFKFVFDAEAIDKTKRKALQEICSSAGASAYLKNPRSEEGEGFVKQLKIHLDKDHTESTNALRFAIAFRQIYRRFQGFTGG